MKEGHRRGKSEFPTGRQSHVVIDKRNDKNKNLHTLNDEHEDKGMLNFDQMIIK
jgi:hypothetical protein